MPEETKTTSWIHVLIVSWSLMAIEATTVSRQNENLASVPTSLFAYDTELIMLTNNAIQRIEDYDFANLPKLQILNIENNQIDYVSKRAFVNSTRVTGLYFSRNQLGCVCDLALPDLHLENVLLDYNPIIEIQPDDLQGFPSLRHLSLKQTSLTEYPNCTHVAHTLMTLTLSNNNLATADATLLATARSVKQLTISTCSLIKIPDFSKFPDQNQLEVLTANNGGLGPTLNVTDFSNLPTLKKVSIEYSNLVEFPDFGSARDTLEMVYLTRNRISFVEVSRLQGFHVLRALYISHNLIASFPFVNSLVDPFFGTLQQLNLEHNPLICDSTTLWIGSTLANWNTGTFNVDDPCIGITYREVKAQQSSLFARVSSENIAGGDDLAVCVSRCMLEPTCTAVSFQSGKGCTLEQQHPGFNPPAGQEWWLNNM